MITKWCVARAGEKLKAAHRKKKTIKFNAKESFYDARSRKPEIIIIK